MLGASSSRFAFVVRTSYFDVPGVRILAHRGLSVVPGGAFENTIPAFVAALDAGATHLETDVRATSDGVAVLFHDADLARATGSRSRIDQLTWPELSRVRLPGEVKVARLDEALSEMPDARFNLDVKSSRAIAPTAAAITALRAHDRVLVSSFSEQRRAATIALLDSPVATSASAAIAAQGYLARWARLNLLSRIRLLQVDALQVPTGQSGLKFDSPQFISWLRELGIEPHFWTVNQPDEMLRLVSAGALGIVTDRTDLVPPSLRG